MRIHRCVVHRCRAWVATGTMQVIAVVTHGFHASVNDIMPIRVQLRRTKGWRMPPGTRKVDRSTRWGNPWRAGIEGPDGATPADTGEAVARFRRMLRDPALRAQAGYPMDLSPLQGADLACWCRPGEPCHADALLERLQSGAA
jgi:hypothetical protein